MNIIPLIKCKDMKETISFYTNILDFRLLGTWPEGGASAFSILERNGAELHLSTFSEDGTFGNVVSILVDNIKSTFTGYVKRGLDSSGKVESPVHQGPVIQSWGTIEFYVDDPSGNTIRFIQR